jgi:sulfate permease, SulP family
MATVAVGVVMVGILEAIERFFPRAPAPLIAVASGIAGTSAIGLQACGVGTVGQVPTGLPSLTLPNLALLEQLWPAALGIALMSFTETIAAGRAFAESGEPTPQANRELLATGLANAGGALLGAMPRPQPGSRWSSIRPWARRWAATGCSSTWSRLSPSIRRRWHKLRLAEVRVEPHHC